MAAACALAALPASAATLFWDGGSQTVDGASQGGTGTWSTSVANWDNGSAEVVWDQTGPAIFGGVGGTVTLGSAITTTGITIGGSSAYTIDTTSANVLSLTGNLTTTTAQLNVLTGAGGLQLSGGVTHVFNLSGNSLNITGLVSGSDNINVTGGGFALAGTVANTYTGKITVTGTGTKLFLNSNDVSLGAVPAAFTADSVTLDGGSLFAGVPTNTTGNFNNATPVLPANRGITLTANGGTFNVGYAGNGGSMIINGVISGPAAGALTKIDGGPLFLTAANTYAGTTIISSGVIATTTLAANGSASGIGTGTAVTLNGGTLRYNGTVSVGDGNFTRNITIGANGGTLDNATGASRFIFFGGTLTGTAAFNYIDSSHAIGQLLVTSNNPGFSGPVNIGDGSANSGFLQYRSNAANPFGTGTIQVKVGGILSADSGSSVPSTLGNALTLAGGQLATQAPNISYTGLISLTTGTNSSVGAFTTSTGTITLSNVVSGSGALTKVSNNVVSLNGGNTYSGGTTVNAGTLRLGNATALGAQAAALTVNTGVLDLNGNNQTVGLLTGSGTGQISNSVNATNSTLTVGSGTIATSTAAYAAVIANNAGGGLTGTVALSKIGAGTQALGLSNTYSGGTTVSSGILRATNAGALGTGTVTLAGGTLQLATGNTNTSTASSSSAFTLNGGATNAGGVLTLTDNGGSEGRSAFVTSPVTLSDAGGFTASFVYTPSGSKGADGVTFTVQNDPRGATALGGTGGALGYGGTGLITNSAAVELNIYTGAAGGIGTALGINGSIPTNVSVSPVALAGGNPIRIDVTYNGNTQTLTEKLTDTVTTANTSTITYSNISLQSLLGAGSAYVGFTGGTGGLVATQTVGSFTFASNASPTQTYANAIAVTANSTINVTGGLTATVGPLSVGANTLSVASTDATNTAYSLAAGATTLTGNAVFDVANSSGGGVGALQLGATSGAFNLTKTGAGNMVLPGVNTYTGVTAVTGTASGSLTGQTLQITGSVSASSALVATGGGTLLLGKANNVNSTAPVTLGTAGGGVNTAGRLTIADNLGLGGAGTPTETFGTLTLNRNSSLDFGVSASGVALVFGGLNFTSGDPVSIFHWTGALGTDDGTSTNDRFLIPSNVTYSPAALAAVQFYNDAGTAFPTGATTISFGTYNEIVPIPEPSTWFMCASLIGLAGWRERRRFRRAVPATAR